MAGKGTGCYIFSVVLVLLSLCVTFVPEFYHDSALIFEMMVQSRPYISIFSLLLLLFFVVKRYYLLCFVQILCVLSGVFWIFGGYSGFSSGVGCSGGEKSQFVRVFSLNAYYKNEKYADIMRAIEVAEADIVFLQEVQSGLYHYGHDALSQKYAFHYSEFEQGIEHGKAIYSKYPLTNVHVQELNREGHRVLQAELNVDGVSLRFIGIHAISPKNMTRVHSRNRQIEALQRHIGALEEEGAALLVAGDFNTTPWHPLMRGFKARSRLNNNGLYNIVGTWPTWFPSFLTIPIDHIFYNNKFGSSHYYRGLITGSDHYPIYADLEMCK